MYLEIKHQNNVMDTTEFEKIVEQIRQEAEENALTSEILE